MNYRATIHDIKHPATYPESATSHSPQITETAFGPQSADIQRDIIDRLESHTDVIKATAQQLAPNTSTSAVEFLYLTDHPTTEPATAIDFPHAYATSVRSTPDTSHPIAFSKQEIDQYSLQSVIVWRHPATVYLDTFLESQGDIYRHAFYWNPDTDTLPYQSETVDWTNVAPLYIAIDAPTTAGETITNDIVERITPRLPYGVIPSLSPAKEPLSVAGESTFANATFTYKLDFPHHTDIQSDAYLTPEDGRKIPHAMSLIDDCSDTNIPEQAQLTITSPPYLDAIDYNGYTANNDTDWSTNASSQTETLLNRWKSLQENIFNAIHEATADGGYCAVIISHVKSQEGEYVPLPHEFSDVMRSIGWNFEERIIWHKVTGGGRFGTTIQKQRPTYYYPNHLHEEIMIWRKGEAQRRDKDSEMLTLSPLMKQEVANNVWNIPPTPPNKDVDHPCPFPEEIAHRLIALYSYPGDLVLDPMAGAGTTVYIADKLDRIGIGTDINSTFVNEARQRVASTEYTRRDQIIPDYSNTVSGDSTKTDLRQAVTDMEDASTERSQPDQERPTEDNSNDDNDIQQGLLTDF